MMSPTSIVSSILLTLPSTVSSTTNSYVLSVVRYVESINNFYINHHHYGKSRFRKFQLMWYILMSATSLVFPSKLSMPFTVSSTTNSSVLNVGRQVESINKFHNNHHHYGKSRSRKFQLMWYILNPHVSDLPGLPLQVVHAVYGVVDHQLTYT